MEPLLTYEEAADLLRISHWTARKMPKMNKLNAVRLGRSVRFELKELERIIERGRDSMPGLEPNEGGEQ